MKQLAYALLVGSMLVASCKGDDGEIGPQGDQGQEGQEGQQGPQGPAGYSTAEKTGFIKGTISGTRRDGTAFTESFENNIRQNPEGFTAQDGMHKITIYRGGEVTTNNRTWLNLLVHNRGTSNADADFSGFEVHFLKQIADNQAFSLNAYANFKDISVVYPISPTNTDFDFEFDVTSNGYLYPSYYRDDVAEVEYLGFNNTSGDIVYFTYPDYDGTSIATGEFGFVLKQDGTKVTTGTKYNGLTLTRKNSSYQLVNAQGVDLSEVVEIPGDTYDITNFKYDSATGIVTFDYTISIAGQGRSNTTRRPLTVTGSVESKVYDAIVYKANGGSEL